MAKENKSKGEEKIFNEVIKQIEAGKSVRQIFRDNDFCVSRSVFCQWLRDNEDKANQYARATSIRADIIFDEMFDIADDGTNDYINVDIGDGIEVQKLNTEHIQRSRLRIDTRKWALSKMNPKKFGDKLDVGLSGEVKVTGLKLVKASESRGDSKDQ